MNNRKGNVLVTVLIMTAFLTSLVIVINEKSSSSYRGVMSLQADNQGGVYAGTALVALRSLMEFDDPEYDGSEDQWANIPSIPVNGGFVSVTVRPADSGLPVNALTSADNASRQRMQEAFEYMYIALGYEDELRLSLEDWVAPSGSRPVSMSVADTTFNPQGNSYTAKFGPISSLYEIRLIPGYPAVYMDLAPHLSVGEQEPKININFADNLTIRALLPELAPYVDEILQKRAEEPLKSKDALYAILGSGNRDVYTAVLPYFDVKSTLFYVKIEVDILDNVQYYHVLMRKNGRRMSIVRYIEGKAIDYF